MISMQEYKDGQDRKTIKEYEKLRAEFKPEFGNQRHIDLIQSLASIDKDEKFLQGKIEETKKIVRLKKELIGKKKSVLNILREGK
jgi:hypothetical protein